jgi:hypothetical protein
MRLMSIIVSGALFGSCAGRQPPMSDAKTVGQKFEQFLGQVQRAADIMDMDVPPVGIADTPLREGDWASVLTMPLPAVSAHLPFTYGAVLPTAQILVRPWYLEVENEQGFEHAAYHEMCHIKLGHPGTTGDVMEKEYAAARCVIPFVEEDDYYAALRRIAVRMADEQNRHVMAVLDEHSFRALIDTTFGIAERNFKKSVP